MKKKIGFYLSILFTMCFPMESHAFGGRRPSKPNPPPSTPGNAEETKRWEKLLKDLGGSVIDPRGYEFSSAGFHEYLVDSGIQKFSGEQLVEAHNPDAARQCGLSILLPGKESWVRGAALALWTEELALVAGETPYLRNWYRPTCYNSAVGGAKSSDHIEARAFDVDFPTAQGRKKAQDHLCTYWESDLNMQVGLGNNSIHFGAESPRGKRNWYYSSYQDSDRNNTCFD